MTQQGIEVFLTVARLGSVSAAAQALYITQPAVSRHLQALEEDLGCPLVLRGRGQRQVELTDQGRDFVQVAEKWRMVWQEAREVAAQDRKQTLRVASVGSLVSSLLPPVLRDFLTPGRTLSFHNYHSREAYDYVAQGLTDIALISDHMYHPQVETVPAFRTAMVLLTGPVLDLPRVVHPSQLDPAKELRLPWNPEYDLWHSFWFRASAAPRAELDQMRLLEEFFRWQDSWPDSWAVAPALVAVPMARRLGLTVRTLDSGPADEIIYYLLGPRRKQGLTRAFLDCLDRELQRRPEAQSLLSAPLAKSVQM
ncbi:MAG: LysR family transcriptional regulator [Lawsonibacter sp.]|nr:LysR family transcriptional regulator [Lawsonibacter sp.]